MPNPADNLVPSDAWDTHIHVFDPDRFPFPATRGYTPAAASLEQYPRDQTGCKNIVIVQGTVQGTDTAPLLDTLSREASESAAHGLLRGLAVLNLDETSDQELDRLHAAGVRGIRLHEVSWGVGAQISDAAVAEKLRNAAKRLLRLNWVIDIYVHPKTWVALAPTIDALPTSTKIVADHWGCLRPGDEESVECKTILDLVRRKRIFVKLASTERQTYQNPAGTESMSKLAKLLLEAGPDRLFFGSDWPHTATPASRKGKTIQERLENVEEFRQVDLALIIIQLRSWIQDEETWRKLWVNTPRALFA